MTSISSEASLSAESRSLFRSPRYGWVIVVLAALAMVATLPGRTHGLGMITERLLVDPSLGLNLQPSGDRTGNPEWQDDVAQAKLAAARKRFSDVNLWATLLGALFCLPCGWMIDRMGLRISLTVVVALLGLVVLAMTRAQGMIQFAFLITLTRGLGQSALSVISISMIGKWFHARLPLATGVYSALVSIGFIGAFLWGRSQSDADWRTLWQTLGFVLVIGLIPLFWLLVPSAPAQLADRVENVIFPGADDFTLREALSTPAFWALGFATSLYGLVSSGVSLFNESLLAEHGFEKTAFYDLSMMTTGIGLAANLITGWVATRLRITTVAAAAMTLLASALLGLRFVSTYPELVVYAVAMGCAGGMVTVLFFAVWARLYGRAHLGRIQGVAQLLTVVASALGPRILATVKEETGSYQPAIVALGLLAAAMAVLVAIVPLPRRQPTPDTIPEFERAAQG